MNTEGAEYNGIKIPKGFAPTKITGEDSVDVGLVITDKDGNEYVWVEVPKTTEVYPTAGLIITNFTAEEYQKIEKDLHAYTSDYRNGTEYKDAYYPDSTYGWFENEEEYNSLKYKMLKSVYKNGGFWIGRYEAGIEKWRTSYDVATITPLSKANLYPYTYVTRTQAKVLAEQVEAGDFTSSLMFGVQGDLTFKYIENKKIDRDSEIKKKIIEDSVTIGNYTNSTFKLNKGMYMSMDNVGNWYNYDSDLEKYVRNQIKLTTGSVLLTTGASDEMKLQNIYDIPGNSWEWTLEKTNDDRNPCTHIGGGCVDKSTKFPAGYRTIGNINYNRSYLGFRVVLFE